MPSSAPAYSFFWTVLLVLVWIAAAPFCFLLAIVLGPPWLLLGLYIVKRMWTGHSTA